MATKNIGGSIDPLVPPALNLTFEGQKRLPTADSISLSFKTLLSLVEKLFWSICSVTTFGAGKIAKICSKLYAMLCSDINEGLFSAENCGILKYSQKNPKLFPDFCSLQGSKI